MGHPLPESYVNVVVGTEALALWEPSGDLLGGKHNNRIEARLLLKLTRSPCKQTLPTRGGRQMHPKQSLSSRSQATSWLHLSQGVFKTAVLTTTTYNRCNDAC